tara:strand:+ start:594 stop:1028 length:435 start_codon:yes stop_codon:yes gene_type:complete
MIPNFSKILLVIISFIFITSYINCGKSVKKAPSELPNKQEKQIDIYSKLDVCGCNKEAIEIIELAREIRDEFETIAELKMQKESVKQIRGLASNYTKLLESCFRRHASKNFIPSECNKLNELDRKRSELFDLGIPLVQGERLKL